MKKQKADDPGAGENTLRSRLETSISSNVGEVLGSGSAGDSKDSETASATFGGDLKPKEPAPAEQQMEEEL